MKRAPDHPHEAARLEAVRATGLLDTAANPMHVAVARLIAKICRTPIAAVSLVDADRQWFAGEVGLNCRQTSREVSFCAYAILGDGPFIVEDTLKDQRFVANRLVTGPPGIRFYAGTPLKTRAGLPLGSLCVIDTVPRALTLDELESLKTLAQYVAAHLELSLTSHQLHRELSLHRVLIDSATDYAMITLDPSGRVTSWNPGAERIYDRTAQSMIGRPYREVFDPEEIAAGRPEEILHRAISLGRSECGGWRVRRDGSRVHIAGTLASTRDEHGKVQNLIKVAWEDTQSWINARELERRSNELLAANQSLESQARTLEARAHQLNELREVAESANRSKSEFLANMSHEIRTPMTAILGYTELLASTDAPALTPEQQSEYVNAIRRNGTHLLAVINDILDLSRIEAGGMSVESIPVNFAELVRDVCATQEPRAKAQGLSFDCVLNGNIPASILTDPVRLRQILSHVVGNAIKFTHTGGVTVQARVEASSVDGHKLRIVVRDTGNGMGHETIAKLFQPFAQGDASTTRKHGGTGLGLRISRGLAHLLGGDITVTSEPGRGSEFVITIQAGVAESATQPLGLPIENVSAGRSVLMAPEPLKNCRIYFAEDGVDNQRLIAFHLRKAGAEVRVFDNGRFALEALTADGMVGGPLKVPVPCDLIITDMQMPEMDGEALVRAIRSKGCGCPIIALTAHAMVGDAEKCLSVGCDAYASKPIDRQRLIDTCVRVMRSAASLRSAA